MFATVECKDAENSFRTFVRDLFSLPEIIFQRVTLPDADDFYRVIATEYRGQVPVAEVTSQLTKLKGSVLFDINFPDEESTRCLEFHSERLPGLLLFNSFTDYMQDLKLPAEKSSLTVFDSEGIYTDVIDKAVKLFAKIEVYTKRPDLYNKTSQSLLERYGISIIIRDSFSGKSPKSTVILCPEEVPFCSFYQGIIFTLRDNVPPCSCAIIGEGIDLPPVYELHRPNGIDKLSFASALYEKSNAHKLGKLSCRKLRII